MLQLHRSDRSRFFRLAVALTLTAACDSSTPSEPDATAEAKTNAEPSPSTSSDSAQPTAPPDTADEGSGDPGTTKPAEPTPEPKPTVMAPPPAADSLTLHALAAYEIVTLYAKPDMESTKLGYLRMGHRAMVTPKLDDQGEGCRKGWHQFADGAYACASKGLTVSADKQPYMHQPPPRPRIDEPMPYDYGVVARNGTAMWWRTADALERELAAEKYTLQVERKAAAAALAAGEPPPAPKPKAEPKPKPTADSDEPAAAALPGVNDEEPPPPVELTPEQIAEQERKREEELRRQEEERQMRLEKMKTLPLHPETPFLEKGFIVTTALKTKDKGRSWWRTSRGGYLEVGKVYKRGAPKVIGLGQELVEETSGFPFGFVGDKKAPVFAKNDADKLQRVGTLTYRDFVDGVEQLEVDGREYLRMADDRYVRVDDLRLGEPQTPPEGIDPQEGRWIDVQLSKQLLVAYEGERPVFTTLVSTGRKGTEEEPFDTPTGTFTIKTKHVSSTMDGNTASDGAYSIQDVPWAMFFHGSYALHGAFWHGGFGSRRSHGCINLAPADARWLFWWVGPELPEGWHGAAAHEAAPGTTVVVR